MKGMWFRKCSSEQQEAFVMFLLQSLVMNHESWQHNNNMTEWQEERKHLPIALQNNNHIHNTHVISTAIMRLWNDYSSLFVRSHSLLENKCHAMIDHRPSDRLNLNTDMRWLSRFLTAFPVKHWRYISSLFVFYSLSDAFRMLKGEQFVQLCRRFLKRIKATLFG